MMTAILMVVLLVIVVLYMIFGKVMVHLGAVILNEFIANFVGVSWHVILGSAMAG